VSDSAEKMQEDRSLFKRVLVIAVCAAVAAFLVWVYLYLRPTTWRYYGDDISVRRLAKDVSPKFVAWEKAETLDGDFNVTSDVHEAAISPDGTKMIFSRGLSGDDANLYICRWDGQSWNNPAPMRALNSRFNEISPSFSRDGNNLFFSTDRPGGLGGYDIWVASWDGAEYAWPQPLSLMVNSRFDDIAPRSSAGDSKLYFSSNRPRKLLMKEDDALSYRDLRKKFINSDYDIYAADRFPSGYTNRAVERAMSLLYSLRTSALSDQKVMEKLGGTRESEAAVDRALAWLAKNQETNGCWSTTQGAQRGHDVAATSAALLAYFGRGERHDKPGKYQATVARGLKWLVAEQNRLTGDFRGRRPASNGMYDQALATLAVVEAYGLSKDQDLLDAAQSAVFFAADAQNDEDGGWRYQPKQAGDLSVSGWVIMALKNAEMSGITVPQKTYDGVRKFLRAVSSENNGGRYSYQPTSGNQTPAMQASGFFCSQLMGLSANTPKAFEASGFMRATGVKVEDVYYAYYGTLAANQNQGPLWKEWRGKLQESFLAAQEQDGGWSARGQHGNEMGRVITTALVTLSLQAHYRYVPLYGLGFEPDEKPLKVSTRDAEELPPMPEYDRSRPMTELNSESDDMYAEPTRHGDFVFFASNRGGGFGGFDIYRAKVNGNAVQPPENTGPAVNAGADETAPASTMAGFHLIFSSNRDAAKDQYRLLSSSSRIVFQRYDYSNMPTAGWLWDNHAASLLVLAGSLVLFIVLFLRAVRKKRRMTVRQEGNGLNG